MQINVAQQLKNPIGSTRSYTIDSTMEMGPDMVCPVQGEVTFTRIGQGILVNGTLTAQAQLECSRCLRPFRAPLRFSMEEIFYPTINIADGLPAPAPEEPSAFTIDEHHILDLSEAVRQYCIMAMPMKPLCRADCAGLCPVCGGNLNEKKCNCQVPEVDPRWAKLRELSLPTEVKVTPKKRKGAQ